MKKRNTTKDILLTFITKLFYLGGSFVISVILARLLGAAGKGRVTALFVVPNMLISIADMGVRQAAAYTIGQKKHSVQEVFSSSLFLWIISSTVSMLILVVYYSLPFTMDYEWLLISLALVLVPIKILDTYYYGIHQGLQQIEAMNMRHISSLISRLIAVVVLVWILNLGVFGAAVAIIISEISVGAYSYIKLKSQVKFKVAYIPNLPEKLFKQGITFAVALFLLNINYRLDILILDRLVTATEVGLYSVGVGLAELIWQLPNAIGTVLFSRSANSSSDKEASNRAAKLLRVSLFILVLGSVMFGMTSKWIVPFIYGQEFQNSSGVINLLLPGIVFIVMVQVLHASISGRGYPLLGVNVFAGSIIINVALNYTLIPLYGIEGAAISSTISYTIAGISYAVLYSKKEKISLLDLLVIKKDDINALKKVILSKLN